MYVYLFITSIIILKLKSHSFKYTNTLFNTFFSYLINTYIIADKFILLDVILSRVIIGYSVNKNKKIKNVNGNFPNIFSTSIALLYIQKKKNKGKLLLKRLIFKDE